MKLLVGLFLGAVIGIGCRLFEIPVPGPNAILGALLGIAMAAGYQLTDRVLSRRAGGSTAHSESAKASAKGPRMGELDAQQDTSRTSRSAQGSD